MAEEVSDEFYYARDHDGPVGWCVRGPNDFYMPVPDKGLALVIGKLLSGKYEPEHLRLISYFVQAIRAKHG